MIGILDSGSGGLTVLAALRRELPSADVVYFGDIKHAPYGSRSRRELTQLTFAALELLQNRGAKRMVSACNSISASLAISLYDSLDIVPTELVEMVGPTVAAFKGVTGTIAVCATPATIESGMYEDGFRMIGVDAIHIPIPDLARAIEFGESETQIRAIVEMALKPHLGNFSVLVLACTHYPLVAQVFADVVGSQVVLFDPALAVAQRAKQRFWPQEVGNGTTHFILSQESAQFYEYVEQLLPGLVYTSEVI